MMTVRLRALGFILVSILFFAFPFSSATASSTISPSTINYRHDANSSLTFEDIVAAITDTSSYSPLDSTDVPVSSGNHWVFLTVDRQAAFPTEDWVLEVGFTNIDFFEALVLYEDGTSQRFGAGDEVAFDTWPIDYRKPAVPLRLINEYGALVIFKVKNETPLIFPLTLITKSEIIDAQRSEHFLYGIFYGAIFILALYNAGIYFSLRDPSYRFYILYILSFSLVQASTTGMGQQYLWPMLGDTTTRLALMAIILTNYFMIRFVIEFLDLRTHRPVMIFPLQALANIALALSPLLLLPSYAYTQYATHALNVICMVVILITTFSVLKRNRGPAIYLITSYSVLFSAIGLALMFQTNLIDHFAFLDYSMSSAILVEAVILSIGLSAKITQLRLEREKSERGRRIAQEELSQQLIQARENERAEVSKLLHDSINHDLVVIRNKIDKLAIAANTGPIALKTETAVIDQLLNNTISSVREISHLSHPHFVKHLGLETALRALLNTTFDPSISWDLYFENVILNYDTELLLYRAGQELTTNIIKYANASECLIRLLHDKEEDQLVFIIKDDGDGFESAQRSWRFGLRTLNEHCKSLSGSLDIQSSTGKGTTVTIRLPLTH